MTFKQFLFFAVITFASGLLSCGSSGHAPPSGDTGTRNVKTSNRLREENYRAADSYSDFSKYDSTSTLKLISYVHDAYDCGEWGGHSEKIIIYKSGELVKILYKRNPTDCLEDLHKSKILPKEVLQEYEGVLDMKKQEAVGRYLHELVRHVPSDHRFSNAPNTFEVRFSEGSFEAGFKVNDTDSSWKEYEAFRDMLLRE